MLFTKMHGCGNDYIVIWESNSEEIKVDRGILAKRLCDRHFGIGADGVLYLQACEYADFAMKIYNQDGSYAQMCGNGMRCAARFLYEKAYSPKKSFHILCGNMIHKVEIIEDSKLVKVNMGKPELTAKKIPVLSENEFLINERLELAGKEWRMTCVSMGNPHAVIFVNELDEDTFQKIAPEIAYLHIFPEKVNVELVKVLQKNELEMRVWERGVGETLACGTGCCAGLIASCINGLTGRVVTVKLLGGKLFCEWSQNTHCVYLTGPAEFVYEGEINIY